MNRRLQLVCAWCGPAAVLVSLTGFLIAGVLPLPLGASSTSQQVVDFYSNPRVIPGLIIAQLGICLVLPLIGLIGYRMLRIEGRYPLLTFVQLVSGAVTGVCLLLPIMLMTVAAFRPDRSPELTVTLNDIAWLVFITPIAPFIIQNVVIGIAVLRDQQNQLPRWVGYMNFWIAASFLPDPLAYVFHGGPFAWNGIFIFWLALTTYTIFLVGMGLVLRSIALRSDADESSAVARPTVDLSS